MFVAKLISIIASFAIVLVHNPVAKLNYQFPELNVLSGAEREEEELDAAYDKEQGDDKQGASTGAYAEGNGLVGQKEHERAAQENAQEAGGAHK